MVLSSSVTSTDLSSTDCVHGAAAPAYQMMEMQYTSLDNLHYDFACHLSQTILPEFVVMVT